MELLLQAGAFIMDMLDTVIGGLLAIGASWATQYWQSRNTRKVKMDEAMAARKVTVNAEAYRNIKRLEGASLALNPVEASEQAEKLEGWFFDNLLFLPGNFPDHWLTARTHLRRLARPSKRPAEESLKIEDTMRRALSAAIGEVYKDAGIPRPEWESRMYADLDTAK